jgi:anti-repressor protein
VKGPLKIKQGEDQMKITVVHGIKGYVDEKGVAQLNLEDVARGLGFTETKGDYIRWQRVEGYLVEFGFSTSGEKPEFIPENIFYRLAMKAKNAVAEAFQAKVADEILPTIRQHGAYMTPETIEQTLTNPDFIIDLAMRLKQANAEKAQLQSKIELDKPKVLFAEALETSSTSILIGELAKLLKQNGIEIGQNRLFEKLRQEGYLMKTRDDRWNDPTQKALELGLFEIKKRTINNPDGSLRTTKTTKVTGKGQIYFINKFKTANAS